MSMLA